VRVHEMIGPSDALLAGVGVDPDDAGRRRCRRSRVGLLLDAAGCGVGGGQASVVVRHHVHEARVQKGWVLHVAPSKIWRLTAGLLPSATMLL
jgi:hypothetical protein